MATIGFCILVIVLTIYQQFLQARCFRQLRKYARSLPQLLLATKKETRTICFFDVIPASTGFTCVSSVASRRCGKPVALKRRTNADAIRRGLSICLPSHPSFAPLLDDYARTCICSQKIHCKYEEAIAATVDEWSKQLREVFDSISREADSVELRIPGSFESGATTTSQQSAGVGLDSADQLHRSDEAVLHKYKALFNNIPHDVELAHSPESGGEREEVTPVRSRNANCFQPYVRKSEKTLEEVIWSPLGSKDRESGHLYAFTRSGDEAYIKIGYTTDTVASRMGQWAKDCGYTPIVRYKSQAMGPNAKRIEKLVHTDMELRKKRRLESWCRTNPECRKAHVEWFETSEIEAISCIEYWIKWMTTHEPYDSNGQLKGQWIVNIHLPKAHLEACSDASRFISDSVGKSWISAKVKNSQADPSTSEPTATVQVSNADSDTTAPPQTTRDLALGKAGISRNNSPAPRTPRHTRPSKSQSRRGLDGSASEPILPSAAMVGGDLEPAVDNTPSRPVVSSRTRTSSSKFSPSSRISKVADTPTRRRRRSTSSKSPGRRTTKPASADRAQVENPEVGSSIIYPILIESDTDEPGAALPSDQRNIRRGNSPRAVWIKQERALDPAPPMPSTKPRARSSPSNASSGESSRNCIPESLPECVSNLDFAERFKWRCPLCLKGNSAFTSKCEDCQYCAAEFEVTEEAVLPTPPLGSNGRLPRPTSLDRIPASDPIVPLVRYDFETDEDRETKLSVKARSRRKSEKVCRARKYDNEAGV